MAEDKIVSPGEKSGLFDWLIKHSKKSIIILTIVSLLAALSLVGIGLYNKYFVKTEGTNVVAVFDGENIYLDEYKMMLFAFTRQGTANMPVGLSEQNKLPVLDSLINMRILAKELSENNVIISKEDIVNYAKENFENYDSSNDNDKKAIELYSKYKLMIEKVQSDLVSTKEGYAIYCRYDLEDNILEGDRVKGMRAKQKPYAEKYCPEMKARLESGVTNYTQEAQNLLSDPILGKPVWDPLNPIFFVVFDKETFVPGFFQGGMDDYEQIKTLKEGYHLITIKDDIKDYAIVVVYIKDEGKNTGIEDFDEWLENAKGDSKVELRPERIIL